MEDDATDSCDFARIRRIQPGPKAPGIQLRRPDGRLCVHAGGWNGKRSPRRLFPLSGDPAGLEDWIFHVTKTGRRARIVVEVAWLVLALDGSAVGLYFCAAGVWEVG